jgi:hypothetical protein
VAISIDMAGLLSTLGVSLSLAEAEVNGRDFLVAPWDRGLPGSSRSSPTPMFAWRRP